MPNESCPSIWKEPTELPKTPSILYVAKGKITPRHGIYRKAENVVYLNEVGNYMDWEYIEKWCYLDDLIAQVERQSKALEYALSELKCIGDKWGIDAVKKIQKMLNG